MTDPAALTPPTEPGTGTSVEQPPRRRRGCLFKVLLGLFVVVALVVGLLAVVVWYSRSHQTLDLPPAGQTIPTSPPRISQSGEVRVSALGVQQGGNRRQAEFLLPLHVNPGERLPVVVLLHGASSNGGAITQEGNWEAAVDADHLIVVTPEGVEQTWNAGACCRLASTLGIQDEQFLDALVRDLKLRPEVDPSRIYMVGESNGGIMTYRFLCDHAGELAGAASVVGTNLDGCSPSAPIPIMHVAGTADQAVPYQGGRTSISLALATKAFPAVVPSIEKLAAAEHCGPTPAESSGGDRVTIRDWSGCRSEGRVRLVTIAGMTHMWPRAPLFDGTQEILRFFGLGP